VGGLPTDHPHGDATAGCGPQKQDLIPPGLG
jgi:hypothetical protein